MTNAVSRLLLERCVDPATIAAASSAVPADAEGVLLYGSRARGDHVDASDLDLLVLVTVPRKSVRVGRASVSYYSADQLRSATGTLYGTHLLRDGVVLWERTSALSRVMAELEPANPTALLQRVRELSVVLDDGENVAIERLNGLVKLARYLLRTAIYATSMTQGRPCFSVRELAERFNDAALERLLASDPALLDDASPRVLDELLVRLRDYVGSLPRNHHGSLEALVVDAWDKDRILATVAIRTMTADDAPFDYADLPKVVL